MVLIGGAEERAAIQWEMSMGLRKSGAQVYFKHKRRNINWYQLQLIGYFLCS
jgi:hypothetical protein